MKNKELIELEGKMAIVIPNAMLFGTSITERLKEFFTSVSEFEYGVVRVEYKKKFNFINEDGEFVSPVWFDWMDLPNKDYTAVCLNGKFNYIDIKGNLLSPFMWFDKTYSFNGEFKTIVYIDDVRYTIDRYGNIK